MARTLFLAPATCHAGLTTVALGLVRALDRSGVRVGFYKPLAQTQEGDTGPERSTHFIRATTSIATMPPTLSVPEAERQLAEGRQDELMATIMREFHQSIGDARVAIIEGLLIEAGDPAIARLNQEIVRALGAEVILVGAPGPGGLAALEHHFESTAQIFGGFETGHVHGCIVNRHSCIEEEIAGWKADSRLFRQPRFDLLGAIPLEEALACCRTVDVARHLGAEVLFPGEIASRRVRSISLLARTVPNMLHTFVSGALLVTPADRSDVFMAAVMAAQHRRLAGLVLTGDVELDPRIMEFCRPSLESGLPVMRVMTNSYTTATQLNHLSGEVPIDDTERIQNGMNHVAAHLDPAWLGSCASVQPEVRLSPAAFCHQITERARAAGKRIILPEGNEPRTVKAAAICAARGIARCVLLGNPAEIQAIAASQDIALPETVEILDPERIRANYVSALIELRPGKHLTATIASDQLEDNVMLGTVMLALGEVDGLVSGAVHSSANTIRPALQIIKTRPGAKVVSSVFFMCLPDQVLVYGDCAVNPDPDAETLADIAIQSADSARQFHLEPRVAMISYSTGESGAGADVDKVRAATRLAREKRPDLLLDGPLQYDAAAIADVAATKAPGSPVAGRANVFVFPDLNTGNTTYKAVQRTANVISIGPMLQGLKRPVNDLSRGALVEDIVYTIAITAIQAGQ